MASNNLVTLLIDAGNSRLKWALYRQGQCEPGHPIIYQRLPRPSSRQSLLASQLSTTWRSLVGTDGGPDKIILSNVAGSWLMDALNQWMNEDFQNGMLVKDGRRLTIDTVVSQENAFGVKNAYKNPEMLGADRWAGLIAARHLVPGDRCIIDCGSALTIDVLTEAGEHRGGIIMPGWEMMKKCLVTDIDAITSEMVNSESSGLPLLADNTRDAIEAGITAACAGAIMHVIQRYQDETGSTLNCVITGGGALQLLPLLLEQSPEVIFQHEPDWVLKGLAIISDTIVDKDDVHDCERMK